MFFQLFQLCLATIATNYSNDVVYLDGTLEFTNKTLTSANSNFLTFFGVQWCSHCQLATPHWLRFQRSFSKSLEQDFNIKTIKVECSRNDPLCRFYVKDGFPTFHLFLNGSIYSTLLYSEFSHDVFGMKNYIDRELKKVYGELALLKGTLVPEVLGNYTVSAPIMSILDGRKGVLGSLLHFYKNHQFLARILFFMTLFSLYFALRGRTRREYQPVLPSANEINKLA